MIKFCKKCQEEKRDFNPTGYDWAWKESVTICPHCGGDFVNIDFPATDLRDLEEISEDVSFIEAMIELRSKDIIDYNLKMSQFRQQAETKYKEEERQIPRCPHCNSTNISSIGTGERIGSIAVLGIFSKKINKSFKCKNCGYTW